MDVVAKTEAAEKELDSFINRRSKTKKQANAQEALYAANLRHYQGKHREENRKAWIDYYERMYRAHSRLAVRYAEKALLLEETDRKE